MTNQIQSIPLDKLVPHPDNPNKMSRATFAKLVRNIKRTGRYEPLIVRTCKEQDCFQIINGHHRALALKQLGKKEADCVVWDIDDGQADILLATLNRLCGQDVLDKKLALLKRLSEKMQSSELAKLLPQTKAQLEKLTNLHLSRVSSIEHRESSFLNPLVFFVSDEQQQVVEAAFSVAMQNDESHCGKSATRAARRASALSAIFQYYLDDKQK